MSTIGIDNIGSVIRERRKSIGWSQAKLAEKVGMGQTYVGDIETGRRSPTLRTLVPLLEALGGNLSVKWKKPSKDSK